MNVGFQLYGDGNRCTCPSTITPNDLYIHRRIHAQIWLHVDREVNVQLYWEIERLTSRPIIGGFA